MQTHKNICAEVAKDITLQFAGSLKVRVFNRDEEEINADLAQQVSKFYETIFRKVEELVSER